VNVGDLVLDTVGCLGVVLEVGKFATCVYFFDRRCGEWCHTTDIRMISTV